MALIENTLQIGKGLPGDLATSKHWETESKWSSVPLPFGRAVMFTGTDDTVSPVFGTNKIVGFTLRDRLIEPADQSTPDTVPPQRETKILTRGKIWVEAVNAVSEGDPVFVVNILGPTQGKVRSDNTDAVELPGARFGSSADAGQVVIVDMDLP